MGVCLIFIEGIINIGDTIATLETGIRELLLLHHNFFFPLKKKTLSDSVEVLPETAGFS